MFAKQIWKLEKKFRNIIKRLFYMFGYSIRTVQKLSFSTIAWGESSKIDKIGDLCMSLTIDAFTYSSLILIQLDIEGFELNALQGAEKTIKQHRPIIAIEDNKLNCSEFLGSCDYISPMAIPGLDIWVHKDQTDYLEKLKNIKL